MSYAAPRPETLGARLQALAAATGARWVHFTDNAIPVNLLLDKIPGLKDLDADSEAIERSFGPTCQHELAQCHDGFLCRRILRIGGNEGMRLAVIFVDIDCAARRAIAAGSCEIMRNTGTRSNGS